MSENNNQQPQHLSAAPTRNAEELALKLRLLQAQVADAELKLEKARRDDARAEEEAHLKMQQLRALTEKAELELANLKRESAKSSADAQEARIYTFADQVNDLTIKQAISDIAKMARRFPGEPLTIRLTSPGGSVYHGFALYDFLRSLSKGGNKITVEVLGMAASMGGILLQAGDIRKVGEESMVLIHEVSSGTEGKVSLQQDRLDQSWRLWDKLAHILARRAKATGKKKTMTAAQIKRKSYKFDWWLDAKEAVKLGFADKLI